MNSPLAIPGVVPASRLERPAPPTVSCGIAQVDALTGGLPRGGLTEICGPASSGRTSLLLAVLAETTRRQELCALVDATDSFDPHAAASAGVDLDRLLWVRCDQRLPQRHRGTEKEIGYGFTPIDTDTAKSKFKIQNSKMNSVSPRLRGSGRAWYARIEQALKATDLLLAGGGFSVVAVDLADVPADAARRVPLTSWFRFRRAVEHTPTVLLVIEREPCAKSCASLVLRTTAKNQDTGSAAGARLPAAANKERPPSHAQLFSGLSVEVEVVSSRIEGAKKPARSAGARFESRAEWAG
ncbi:MAG: hypothetical protein ACE14L_15800 [Terriglobales bacterium]